MIDYEEKRSETRHRMGFMTPLLVFVLAFVACCGVIACGVPARGRHQR